MKLISMTDFVLKFGKETNRDNYEKAYDKISSYARFLKQPLTLGMFVPCDSDGNVLTKNTMSEDTCEDDCDHYNCVKEMNQCISYQEAKDRVLFEGLRIEKDNYKQTKRTFYFIGDKRIAHFLEFYSGEKEFSFNLLHDFKTIEDIVSFGFVLTESAKKQIGI